MPELVLKLHHVMRSVIVLIMTSVVAISADHAGDELPAAVSAAEFERLPEQLFDLIARGPWVRKFFADSPLERTTQVAAFRLATEEQMKHDGSYRIPPGFHVFPMDGYLGQPNH